MEREDAAGLTEAPGKGGDAGAGVLLRAVLDEEEPEEVEAWARAQADEPAVAALCTALKHPNRTVRGRAAELLGRIGDRRSVEPLCAALMDAEWSVRARAAAALGKMAEPRSVPPLIEILGHPGWEARRQAAEALARIGPPAIPGLCEALKSEVLPRRSTAARILGRIGDARAVLPLCQALHRGHREAAAALGEIALREPAPELLAAVPLLRQRAEALRFFDSSETQRTLRTALERIEEAITSIQHLPIPAAAPLPAVDRLPVPASPPEPNLESLPVPASVNVTAPAVIPEPDTSPCSAWLAAREGALSKTTGPEARQRWWQRFVHRLRRPLPRPGSGIEGSSRGSAGDR